MTGANPNPMEANEEQMKLREELESDFQIAGVIVDEVQPYSLEYYLGVEHEGDNEYDEDEDEDD